MALIPAPLFNRFTKAVNDRNFKTANLLSASFAGRRPSVRQISIVAIRYVENVDLLEPLWDNVLQLWIDDLLNTPDTWLQTDHKKGVIQAALHYWSKGLEDGTYARAPDAPLPSYVEKFRVEELLSTITCGDFMHVTLVLRSVIMCRCLDVKSWMPRGNYEVLSGGQSGTAGSLRFYSRSCVKNVRDVLDWWLLYGVRTGLLQEARVAACDLKFCSEVMAQALGTQPDSALTAVSQHYAIAMALTNTELRSKLMSAMP